MNLSNIHHQEISRAVHLGADRITATHMAKERTMGTPSPQQNITRSAIGRPEAANAEING
jgi:hypothetical protein